MEKAAELHFIMHFINVSMHLLFCQAE